MSKTKTERPGKDSPEALGFERRAMVNWFDPIQLMGTAIKVLFAWAFGLYSDKREFMPFTSRDGEKVEELIHDYSDEAEVWFDYTADLGDGWDSTYTVASLLARESLNIDGESLPRGRFLVMGGDEVYPTATRDEYRNRTQGPYRAALPWVDGERVPHLYAIPGNHDWYDGLTSFVRLFCQGRWFGGWQTRQTRSYFAIKLPHNWWLWGLDVQLESDLDLPQIDYFTRIAEQAMQAKDKVILCTAEPSWVYAEQGDEMAQRNLHYVEQEIINKQGAEVAVTLAGDLHHYCRYQGEDGKTQKITSGGGGAFLHGTHNLPARLGKAGQGEGQDYIRQGVYPDVDTSRGLLKRNLGFSWLNKRFSLLLGSVYLLYAWLLQSASVGLSLQDLHGTLVDTLAASTNVVSTLGLFGVVHLYTPPAMFLGLVMLVGLTAFVEAGPRQGLWRLVMGALHGAAQVLLVLFSMWAFARLNVHIMGPGPATLREIPLFVVEMLLAGFFIGGSLMGLHLYLSNRWFGLHRTNAMSSLHIADFKNFLRIRVRKQGLSIHPIGIDRVPRRWRLNPQGDKGAAWFEPEDGEIQVRRAEAAFEVPGRD